MKTLIAGLLISNLAFAQTPAAPPADPVPAATPAPEAAPAPAAEPAKVDAPVAAEPAKTDGAKVEPEAKAPTAADNVTASLTEPDAYRVINPIALYAVAGVSVALLIFSVAMDAAAATTRSSATTMVSSSGSLAAQNAAVSQTNAANAGYVLGAVFALATAVMGRFTHWNN